MTSGPAQGTSTVPSVHCMPFPIDANFTRINRFLLLLLFVHVHRDAEKRNKFSFVCVTFNT